MGKGSYIASFVKFSMYNFFEASGMFMYGRAVGGGVRLSDLGYFCICTILYVLRNVWVFDKEMVFGKEL